MAVHCHDGNERTREQIETKTKPTTTGDHYKESLGIFVLISEKNSMKHQMLPEINIEE